MAAQVAGRVDRQRMTDEEIAEIERHHGMAAGYSWPTGQWENMRRLLAEVRRARQAEQAKTFPITRTTMRIPWALAEEAYVEYAKRYGSGQTLERIAERGGWYVEEMDMLRPGWRELDRELVVLKAERDEARQWVRDLHSGMWINCVYCGHRYGPADTTPTSIGQVGPSMAEVLTAHIAACHEHPLAKALTERDAARAQVEALRNTAAGA